MFLTILLLFYVKYINFLKLHANNSDLFNQPIQKYSYYNGNDNRYQKNETLLRIDTIKMRQIFEKKQLLDILQNNYISVDVKLNLIRDDNNVKVPNITAGGLMNNFNFDFIIDL
jgi:hypothetical protein